MDDQTIALLEKVSHIKAIHCGGCGIVMLALYRYLRDSKKLKGDEKFVYLYTNSDDPDLFKNQRYLNGEEDNPSSCCHAVLFHNGRMWDSRGGVDDPLYEINIKLDVEDYEEFVVKSLNNIPRWNHSFDREECIPIIESILNVKLNDIER